MMVFVGIVLIVTSLLGLFVTLELRARDRNLAWVDERDEHIARLYDTAMKVALFPKSNPLDPFKEHGMLSKTAFMRAGEVDSGILQALDERFAVMASGFEASVRYAKALATWEQRNPAPPIHFWQRVPKPAPEPEVFVSPAAAPPLNPAEGQVWHQTDTARDRVWSKGKWVDALKELGK